MQPTQRYAYSLRFILPFLTICLPIWVWAQTPSTYKNSIGMKFVLIPAGTFEMARLRVITTNNPCIP